MKGRRVNVQDSSFCHLIHRMTSDRQNLSPALPPGSLRWDGTREVFHSPPPVGAMRSSNANNANNAYNANNANTWQRAANEGLIPVCLGRSGLG